MWRCKPTSTRRALPVTPALPNAPCKLPNTWARRSSLEAALLWADSAPDERAAQRSAAIHLALDGQYEQASHYMAAALDGDDEHFDFLDLGNLDSTPESRAALLQSLDILLLQMPDNSQLVLSKALLLSQNGQAQQALQLLTALQEKKADTSARLLHVFLLQNLGRKDEALALLTAALKQEPKNSRLRFTRARLLLDMNQTQKAQADFLRLLAQSPDDDGLRYALAQIYLQQQAWQEAIVYLNELVERQSFLDAAHFGLGRAYTALGQKDRAFAEFEQVSEGDNYLLALYQRTDILLAQKRTKQAQQLLAELRDSEPQNRAPLWQMEIELLTKHGQYPAAASAARQALAEFPDSAELLYARAMLAEKQDNLEQMERDLRQIIENNPQSSMALNALGYTLVDRTYRYREGMELIEQALALSPDDPAILDSLGWAHYRLGELDEAEPLLRKAMAEFPDPEVAAHLGEVLWQQGKQREARKIWKQAQENDREHSILQSTILRLTGKANP